MPTLSMQSWREAAGHYERVSGPTGEDRMRSIIPMLYFKLKNRLFDEDGQDLVEYALIVALLSCCAIATEKNVAVSIAGAYQHLSTTFNADL